MVRERTKSELTGDAFSIDSLDTKILALMLEDKPNRIIATELKRPLSTIQRRTRVLLQSGIISNHLKLDYKKFGYKQGLLHIYLSDGDTHAVAEKLSEIENITEVSIHIGNSDIVADYACKGTQELLELLASIKKL